MWFGILLGILLGVTIGITIVMSQVKKSNDLGDSKATFDDFSVNAKISMIESKDRVSKKDYTQVVHMTGAPKKRKWI